MSITKKLLLSFFFAYISFISSLLFRAVWLNIFGHYWEEAICNFLNYCLPIWLTMKFINSSSYLARLKDGIITSCFMSTTILVENIVYRTGYFEHKNLFETIFLDSLGIFLIGLFASLQMAAIFKNGSKGDVKLKDDIIDYE